MPTAPGAAMNNILWIHRKTIGLFWAQCQGIFNPNVWKMPNSGFWFLSDGKVYCSSPSARIGMMKQASFEMNWTEMTSTGLRWHLSQNVQRKYFHKRLPSQFQFTIVKLHRNHALRQYCKSLKCKSPWIWSHKSICGRFQHHITIIWSHHHHRSASHIYPPRSPYTVHNQASITLPPPLKSQHGSLVEFYFLYFSRRHSGCWCEWWDWVEIGLYLVNNNHLGEGRPHILFWTDEHIYVYVWINLI